MVTLASIDIKVSELQKYAAMDLRAVEAIRGKDHGGASAERKSHVLGVATHLVKATEIIADCGTLKAQRADLSLDSRVKTAVDTIMDITAGIGPELQHYRYGDIGLIGRHNNLATCAEDALLAVRNSKLVGTEKQGEAGRKLIEVKKQASGKAAPDSATVAVHKHGKEPKAQAAGKPDKVAKVAVE